MIPVTESILVVFSSLSLSLSLSLGSGFPFNKKKKALKPSFFNYPFSRAI
jgi:hypothetical protein